MNFKTIIASTLIVAGSLVAAPVSAEMLCDTVDGTRFCGTPGRYSDELMVTNEWGTETIEISCANDRYSLQSRGDWSQSQVELFGENYCEGRGWSSHN